MIFLGPGPQGPSVGPKTLQGFSLLRGWLVVSRDVSQDKNSSFQPGGGDLSWDETPESSWDIGVNVPDRSPLEALPQEGEEGLPHLLSAFYWQL